MIAISMHQFCKALRLYRLAIYSQSTEHVFLIPTTAGNVRRFGCAVKRITLSFFVYYVTTKMPLATIIGVGLFCYFLGGLSVHFWWHWCPPGSISAG
jgi:hypothetical protein